MADMNCITTYEGKVVNLKYYETFAIEPHSAAEGVFQVKAHPSRNASTSNPANLAEGTKDECKAYVRERLAPQLGLDVDDPHFIAHYGEPLATEAKPKTTRGSKKTAE